MSHMMGSNEEIKRSSVIHNWELPRLPIKLTSSFKLSDRSSSKDTKSASPTKYFFLDHPRNKTHKLSSDPSQDPVEDRRTAHRRSNRLVHLRQNLNQAVSPSLQSIVPPTPTLPRPPLSEDRRQTNLLSTNTKQSNKILEYLTANSRIFATESGNPQNKDPFVFYVPMNFPNMDRRVNLDLGKMDEFNLPLGEPFRTTSHAQLARREQKRLWKQPSAGDVSITAVDRSLPKLNRVVVLPHPPKRKYYTDDLYKVLFNPVEADTSKHLDQVLKHCMLNYKG